MGICCSTVNYSNFIIKVRCKFCNDDVSCKVERIRHHMEKCSKIIENNNSENENIENEKN